MSKRLNKRQQRELEELEQLKAIQDAQIASSDEEEEELEDAEGDVKEGAKPPVNPFGALEEDEVDEDDSDDAAAAAPKKSKKKKPKKKKKSTAGTPIVNEQPEGPDRAIDQPSLAASDTTSTTILNSSAATATKKSKKGKTKKEDDGLDEIDRALRDLGMPSQRAGAADDADLGASRSNGLSGGSALGFRQSLAVDPKNLDAEAELKRFFGSKVISSSAPKGASRGAPSSKLRYTISKPKPNYPPSTSLAGLGMRELTEDEVLEVREHRIAEWSDPQERWFTFEHAGNWREVVRQFMGAVQSHDPNTLMALLQVYPWHVDTLLQMSEVYRLQSDIGAASDYAERALYALDRCLAASFNTSTGLCRLDFNRVENRPMFMALHRIIAYLGRRGCWVTAYSFAKLLFSLDPMNDPHGAAFWLDFLAIKSNNHQWILDIFEKYSEQHPAAVFQGYPGMGYAYALACRAREDAENPKTKENGIDRTRSNDALREAMLAFPQVILPMADKLGVSIPDAARSEPLLEVQAGFSSDPTCPVHLLSHIYVSRSEALWKDAKLSAWFESTIPIILADLHRDDAALSRADVNRLIHTPRDPLDESLNVPLFICRHVLCSESTSFLGFLPPVITSKPFAAYDPLPPSTAVSAYNSAYFAGVRPTKRSAAAARALGNRVGQADGGRPGMRQFMQQIYAMVDQNPDNWREALRDMFTRAIGTARAHGEDDVPEDAVEDTLRIAEDLVRLRADLEDPDAEQGDGAGMPGAFPE